MTINRARFVTAASLAAIATGLPGIASAQTTPPLASSPPPAPPAADTQDNSNAIGDIIVTAQRRDESLQKTSVVLDVVSPKELARAGVTNVADIGRVSTGVQIGTATASPQIYIRGVGDFAGTTLNNPAVALNVDGVYIARPESLQTDFYDLQRVEVLKGPQGTLYGRNASGGAINLITARPKLGQFGVNFSTEFGNYDAVTTSAALNVPIGDTFAIRVAGNYVRRDGYTVAGFGDASNEAVRVRAFWQPSKAVSLLLNFSAGHVGGKGPATVIGEAAGFGKFADAVSPVGRAYVNSRIPDGSLGGPNIRAQVVLPDGSQAGTNMNFLNISAELNADLGFANLTIIPAYRKSRQTYQAYPFLRVGLGDSFSIPGPTPGTTARLPAQPDKSDAKSVEVRLGNESAALKWVVGLYYYNEKQYNQYSINVGPLQQGGIRSDLNTEALAGFAQGTYSITDKLRVIGGVRYTTDRRELSNGATYAEPFSIFGFGGPPTFAPIPGPPFAVLVETYAGKRTFKNTSWKAGIEYDVAPDSLFFLTASSGFKAGGFNQLAAFGAPGKATAFLPEKLTAFDAGLKNRFFNNKLQLNLGAFYWDYKNQQVNRFGINSAGGIGIEFVNAQKAEIYGGNVDVVARPWSGGTLTGSVEYTHARYKTFIIQSANVPAGSTGCVVSTFTPVTIGPNGPLQNIDCSGKPVARAPEWTGSVGLSQDIALGDAGKITLSGDMAFSSSRELTFDYVAATHAGAFQVFNASIGYAPRDERFSVLAFIRNITNEEVFTGGNQPNFAPNTLVGSVQLPRTYGVRFGFQF